MRRDGKITKCSQPHRKPDGPERCMIKVKWILYLQHSLRTAVISTPHKNGTILTGEMLANRNPIISIKNCISLYYSKLTWKWKHGKLKPYELELWMFVAVERTSKLAFLNDISYLIDTEIYILIVSYVFKGVKSNQWICNHSFTSSRALGMANSPHVRLFDCLRAISGNQVLDGQELPCNNYGVK